MQPQKGLLKKVIRIGTTQGKAQAETIQTGRKELVQRLERAAIPSAISAHQLIELFHFGSHLQL
jgi:hypothetical protein